MFFYLPAGPDSYSGVFSMKRKTTTAIASHSVIRNNNRVLIWPATLTLDSFHPQNFIDLQEKLSMERICLIDRVKTGEPLVQIVDHRNLSGQNPLSGRTPMGNRPRFPDVSAVYDREDLGLPQRVVNTVGPRRFEKTTEDAGSEVAALVALCASYAGIKVLGIGWNRDIDTEGEALKLFLENKSPIPVRNGALNDSRV